MWVSRVESEISQLQDPNGIVGEGGIDLINDITVFDFETSGLSPDKDRVIEMAAIRIRGGEVVGSFSTLVNQPITITAKITEITGITQAEMEDGMPERQALAILNQFMIGSTLVAHNAAFDLGFLHCTLQRLAGKTFDHAFIDTLTICRDRYPYPHKLTDMCDRFGIQLDGAHRALNDVYGCWEVLKALHEAKPITEYKNVLGYLNKYGPPKIAPEYATLVGQDNRYEPRNAG